MSEDLRDFCDLRIALAVGVAGVCISRASSDTVSYVVGAGFALPFVYKCCGPIGARVRVGCNYFLKQCASREIRF